MSEHANKIKFYEEPPSYHSFAIQLRLQWAEGDGGSVDLMVLKALMDCEKSTSDDFIVSHSPGTLSPPPPPLSIYNLTEWKWTSSEMQSTVGQFSRKVAKRGDKVTWGLTGALEQTPQKDHETTRSLRGGVMRMGRGATSAWIQRGRPQWTRWTSSHTPCRSLAHTTHISCLAPFASPYSTPQKSVNGGQHGTSEEEKHAGIRPTYPIPEGSWQAELSYIENITAQQAVQPVRRTQEGMSGEEEDDARVQQSHLIHPKNYRVKWSLSYSLVLYARTPGSYALNIWSCRSALSWREVLSNSWGFLAVRFHQGRSDMEQW